MKKMIRSILSCTVILVLVTGCGNSNAGHTTQNNNVDNVLNQQIDNAEKEAGKNTDTESKPTAPEQTSDNAPTQTFGSVSETEEIEQNKQESSDTTKTEEIEPSKQENSNSAEADPNVDYDLTQMGSDMVYATVYQLMVNPDDYIGKTFKMDGLYYSTFYEPTEQYYHYCIISDATACCAQGIEFIWDEGNHKYPEEYPEEYSEIIITGTFETYREDNDPNLYCRLNNATLETN